MGFLTKKFFLFQMNSQAKYVCSLVSRQVGTKQMGMALNQSFMMDGIPLWKADTVGSFIKKLHRERYEG